MADSPRARRATLRDDVGAPARRGVRGIELAEDVTDVVDARVPARVSMRRDEVHGHA